MKWNALGDIKLLIADDDDFNRQLIISLLGKVPSIHFFQAEDGVETLDILDKESIDMVLLDLHMPKMNGYATLREIKKEPKYDAIPIVIITTDEQEMNKLYSLGADDFISKPFKLSELESRIYAHVEKRQYRQRYNQLSKQEIQKTLIASKNDDKKDKETEEKIKKNSELTTNKKEYHSLHDIENTQKKFFYNMIKLLDNNDNLQTLKVVATLAKALSLLMGYNKNRANNIYYASIIKEIGILSIKEKKPLTYQLLQKDKEIHHKCMVAGYQLLDNALQTEFIKISKIIITQHKEHFDGSGFPQQRQTTQVHNIAYIVAIVEVFNALLSQKDYLNQKIHTPQETYNIIKEQSSQRFHPQISKLFLEHFDYFIQLREKALNTFNKRSI